MVASTDIKFYVHTNTNAPQLTNDFGCMINVLDACLVNGFGTQAVSTLTASGTTVAVTFGSAHNFMQYQVIKITGATQPEYNGEHRILTVPNANSITFQLETAPSVTTATGTINCSLPPLGWEKPFSSTGKAAYRSTNLLLPSRPFLRVVDELDPVWTSSYAKYAKVGIVEDMTDIDTMLGVQAPFDPANPDNNWVGTGSGTTAVNGWAKWYYARTSSLTTSNDTQTIASGNRDWLLVGNSDYFYIFPCFTPNTGSELTKSASPYGFGAFERYYDDDVSNTFLASSVRTLTANQGFILGEINTLSSAYMSMPFYSRILLLKPIEQTSTMGMGVPIYPVMQTSVHDSGGSNYLSTTDRVSFYPVTILEVSNDFTGSASKKVDRGQMPGLYALGKTRPLTDFQIVKRVNDLFIGKHCAVRSANVTGQMVLKIGEL